MKGASSCSSSMLLPGLQVFQLNSASGAMQQVSIACQQGHKASQTPGSSDSSCGICSKNSQPGTCGAHQPVRVQQQQVLPTGPVSRIPKGPAAPKNPHGCLTDISTAGSPQLHASGHTDDNHCGAVVRVGQRTARRSKPTASTKAGGAAGCLDGAATEHVPADPSMQLQGCSCDSSSSQQRSCCDSAGSSHGPPTAPTSHFKCGPANKTVSSSRYSKCWQQQKQQQQQSSQCLTGSATHLAAPAPSLTTAGLPAGTSSRLSCTGNRTARENTSGASQVVPGVVSAPQLLQYLQLSDTVRATLALPQSQSQQRYRERQRCELYALNAILAKSEEMRRTQQQQQQQQQQQSPASCKIGGTSTSVASCQHKHTGIAGSTSHGYQGV